MTKDFSLINAIHPVRYRLFLDETRGNTIQAAEQLLQQRGTLAKIQKEASAPYDSFISHMLKVRANNPDFGLVLGALLPDTSDNVESLVGSPIYRSILHHFAHAFTKAPVLRFEADVMVSLSQTDVSANIPLMVAKPPFGLSYIAFDDYPDQPTMYSKEEQRSYVLEGAYVSWSQSSGGFGTMDMVLMGRPVNNPIDDMFFFVQLVAIDNGEVFTIGQAFENGMNLGAHQSFIPGSEDFVSNQYGSEMFEPVLTVLKCLCFLNWNEVKLQSDNSLSQALKNLGDIKNSSKLEKAKRMAYRNVNQILVKGRNYGLSSLDGQTNIGSLPKSVHWRRGHFRNTPVGPRGVDRRLSWIKPTLVNRERLGAEDALPVAKEYKARS